MWIRDDFLRSSAYHGKIVIHGHTPVDEPDLRPNRINIDTGACASGRLTASVLEGQNRRFCRHETQRKSTLRVKCSRGLNFVNVTLIPWT